MPIFYQGFDVVVKRFNDETSDYYWYTSGNLIRSAEVNYRTKQNAKQLSEKEYSVEYFSDEYGRFHSAHWYFGGKRHRDDNLPAIEYADGKNNQYFRNGVEFIKPAPGGKWISVDKQYSRSRKIK